MGYTDRIVRNDTVMPSKEILAEIVQGVVQNSKVLPLMTKLPNLTTKTESMKVLSLLPEGYWLNGDDGLKGTTKLAWDKKNITAEEIAVIVPIPKAVLDDADYDIFGEAKPRIIEAFYKAIDEAIISGKNKPASFPAGLIAEATTKGQSVTASGDLYKDISDAMGYVEEDGFEVNGILGGVALKKTFREGFRDANGQPLNASEVTELPRAFVNNGAWDKTTTALVGDFKQAVYSFRQDFTFEVFDTGVIQDGEGNILYNLLQQDMVALRCVLRMGWQLPNPINSENPDESTRFPFAVIK